MSENQNPQGGTPNPYGNQNPYGDPKPYVNPASESVPQPPPSLYFDPNNNTDPNAAPGFAVTGAPGGGKSQFDNQPAQNWSAHGVHPAAQEEANKKATLALILGIISFFFLGLFLSVPGYLIAQQAEAINGENAKAARIVNLISIGVSIIGGLFFILIFLLGIAGSASSR